jgi:DNA excision repair protein ERCC-3
MLDRPVPWTYTGSIDPSKDSVLSGPVAGPPLRPKPGAEKRLIWVHDNGFITFDYFSFEDPVRRPVSEFLVAISEPVSRPLNSHQYQITFVSLYSAIALGLTGGEIIDTLDRFSKNHISMRLLEYIELQGRRLGKVKLVLRQGVYTIESGSKAALDHFTKLPEISQFLVLPQGQAEGILQHPLGGFYVNVAVSRTGGESGASVLENLKKTAFKSGYPLLEEYDYGRSTLRAADPSGAGQVAYGGRAGVFYSSAKRPRTGTAIDLHGGRFRGDVSLTALGPVDPDPNLNIKMRRSVEVRDYQTRCLNKMFGSRSQVSRSGIIVLPCGAGKTLVGILATATVRKRTLILCNTAVAVDQWRRQLRSYTTIEDSDIITFTAGQGNVQLPQNRAVVVISTYTMIGLDYEKRSREGKALIDRIKSLSWGLLVSDEVQVMPAATFRRV